MTSNRLAEKQSTPLGAGRVAEYIQTLAEQQSTSEGKASTSRGWTSSQVHQRFGRTADYVQQGLAEPGRESRVHSRAGRVAEALPAWLTASSGGRVAEYVTGGRPTEESADQTHSALLRAGLVHNGLRLGVRLALAAAGRRLGRLFHHVVAWVAVTAVPPALQVIIRSND